MRSQCASAKLSGWSRRSTGLRCWRIWRNARRFPIRKCWACFNAGHNKSKAGMILINMQIPGKSLYFAPSPAASSKAHTRKDYNPWSNRPFNKGCCRISTLRILTHPALKPQRQGKCQMRWSITKTNRQSRYRRWKRSLFDNTFLACFNELILYIWSNCIELYI